MKYTKRILAEKIATLSSIQQKEILTIVSRHNVPVSTNDNGHFFDMEDVPIQCLKTINEFVDYSISNREILDQYDRDIQLRKYIKTDNEEEEEEVESIVRESSIARDPVIAESATQDPDITSVESSHGAPIKFINCKKKFNKAPKNKKYDPDDVSALI